MTGKITDKILRKALEENEEEANLVPDFDKEYYIDLVSGTIGETKEECSKRRGKRWKMLYVLNNIRENDETKDNQD